MDIDKNKYDEFEQILSGCRTILDAYYFGEIYNKYNAEMKSLVSSMINGKRYEQVIDLKTMSSTLETLNNCVYREDAEEIIAKNKQMRPVNKPKVDPPVEKKICVTKNCPHCSRECKNDINVEYTICGYNDPHVGYDLQGCTKDWCFKCGKMLCKSWGSDELFLPMNRYHNSECCKIHAKENSKQYLEEYCQCVNDNVLRKN
jgi:hypothetical protein